MTAERYFVISHARPDGDAIASTCAMGLYLTSQGKEVIMVNQDASKIPDNWRTIPWAEKIVGLSALNDHGENDTLICLDCAKVDRLGITQAMVDSFAYSLNMDHHETNTRYAKENIVVPDAPACAWVLMTYLRDRHATFTPELAGALYAGMSTDTNSFKTKAVTPTYLRDAADLLEAGVDVAALNRGLDSKSAEEMRQIGAMMKDIEQLQHKGATAVRYLLPQSKRRSENLPMLNSSYVKHFDCLRGCDIAYFIEELASGGVQVSIRSKTPRINAAKLMQRLFGPDGGGHDDAAGAKLHHLSLAEVAQLMAQADYQCTPK